MKHINIYIIALSIVMLVLVGCSDSNTITGPKHNDIQFFPVVEDVVSIKNINSSKAIAFPILTIKEELVGTVSVQNDKEYLYLTYTALKDWAFIETNVHIAADVRGIPHSREGYPSPHLYAHMDKHEAEAKVQAYSVMIPLSDYSFRFGQEIYIAANFGLKNLVNSSDKEQLVIGWGGDKLGPGQQWWTVIPYTLKADKNGGGGDLVDNDVKVLAQTIDPDIN